MSMVSGTIDKKVTPDANGFILSAKRFFKSLSWLSPLDRLPSVGSRDFGRGIEAALNKIKDEHAVIRLQLRKKDTAVVMSIKQYEDIVKIKSIYEVLLKQVRDQDITDAIDEYEALYQRITSTESRQAANALFDASSTELANAYQPGQTETQ